MSFNYVVRFGRTVLIKYFPANVYSKIRTLKIYFCEHFSSEMYRRHCPSVFHSVLPLHKTLIVHKIDVIQKIYNGRTKSYDIIWAARLMMNKLANHDVQMVADLYTLEWPSACYVNLNLKARVPSLNYFLFVPLGFIFLLSIVFVLIYWEKCALGPDVSLFRILASPVWNACTAVRRCFSLSRRIAWMFLGSSSIQYNILS